MFFVNLLENMKRTNPDYSTTVVEENSVETVDYGTQSQPVLKLKRSRQAVDASKRLAFELSQYSTQQEILQTLVDLEKELPLESLEVAEFVIRTLWERFYETVDTAVRVKVVSLIASVGSFQGVNIQALVDDLINLLNADGENRTVGKAIQTFTYFVCCGLAYGWGIGARVVGSLCGFSFSKHFLQQKYFTVEYNQGVAVAKCWE